MSIRSILVSELFLRPNKFLYRIFRPTPKTIRSIIHPLSSIASFLTSPIQRVTSEKDEFDGVPGVIYHPIKTRDFRRVIVYLHGGGYCWGSSKNTHRIGLSNFARITKISIYCIEYRLAPEHPYPAALEDVQKAWNDITRRFPESEIILAGDSAGGGLSLALMMRIRDNGAKMPDASVLFSPWTDLTCSFDSYNTRASSEPMFPRVAPEDHARYYVPEKIDKSIPEISPVNGSFRGLPRLLILVGNREILLDDSRQACDKASKDGVDVRLDIWPKMFHDWWLFGFLIPESEKCLREVARWICLSNLDSL
ncbi:MAG TPA: alpha/beta hydrolase [Candidatus Poseidoniales archaeon]|nr:MAG: alpha/beta hydrolase [Euryarchaeota archaeon]HIG33689.1 alpha/beta hydrolase [Candidatus Poseidoniales archaeon]HIL68135.1 alpha/beta hydrolase [Candidatus Poseidoniales archaeon]